MTERRVVFAEGLLGKKINKGFRKEVGKNPSPTKNKDSTLNMEWERSPKHFVNREKERVVESACFSCNSNCEVLIYLDAETDEVLRVEGDPSSPHSRGRLCAKGLAAADLVKNPDRLGYPLKRMGKRGEGKWETISWDEALSITAEKILEQEKKYGKQGIAFLEGTRRGWSRVYSRLANAFGAVNHGAAGWAQCLWPRQADTKVTFGAHYTETADFENTNCMLVWGVNPPATWPVAASKMMDARQRGVGMIVVDPYMSETASKADLWLQLRPGTDTALALALAHVIIHEELYDKDFVQEWTTGFEEFSTHVRDKTPEWGEEITRVPAELIRRAARMYAQADPACIYRCVALDGLHDSVQACRAVSILAAITGNIDIPGGNILVSKRGEHSQNTHDFILADMIPPEIEVLRRGYEEFPLLCSKFSPVPCAHMPTLWETVITGEPYPIRSALIFGSNAVVSYSNADRVREALVSLEFLVVTDLFMTPTAELADIVLPASSWLERDNVISSFQASPTHTYAQKKATAYKEAKSDIDIICQLAKKLGIGEYFWEDSQELYDQLLAPTGLDLDAFKEKKRIYAPIKYKQYEENGFKTPSGKVELYSSILEQYHCDPMPEYIEPFESPTSTPDLHQRYPYILTTGGRLPVYRHSENRQNPLLREIKPKANIIIHPETAKKLGIEEDQKMIIETRTGKAIGYAQYSYGIHPDVLQATPGWWEEDNINKITNWGKYSQGMGTVPMRGILCNIRRPDKMDETDERRTTDG